MRLLITLGAQRENLYMIDRKGVIHRGRDDLNQYKAMFAVDTEARTLADACEGADVFLGLSGANLLSEENLKRMAPNPWCLPVRIPTRKLHLKLPWRRVAI